MYRKETNSNNAYSNYEIFIGNIVIPNQDSGYWTSNSKHKYPNPFLIKLCKSIWKIKP
jgi:hypothetical protein